jgi:hypothetical protein
MPLKPVQIWLFHTGLTVYKGFPVPSSSAIWTIVECAARDNEPGSVGRGIPSCRLLLHVSAENQKSTPSTIGHPSLHPHARRPPCDGLHVSGAAVPGSVNLEEKDTHARTRRTRRARGARHHGAVRRVNSPQAEEEEEDAGQRQLCRATAFLPRQNSQ